MPREPDDREWALLPRDTAPQAGRGDPTIPQHPHEARGDATVPDARLSDHPLEPEPSVRIHDTVTAIVDQPESFAWEDRLLDLECQLEVATRKSLQVSLLLEIGELNEEKLDDREAALRAYEQVLRLEPESAQAFEALSRLYYLEWKTEKLVELLIDRAGHVQAPREQAGLLSRVADLYQQLNQPDKAIIALEAAHTADPDSQTVQRRLQDLTRPPEPTQRKAELELLREHLENVRGEAEKVELYERMAALYQERGELDSVARCLEQALALDPRRQSCYRRLEQIWKDGRQVEKLVAVLRRHAEVAPADERLALLHRLAKLLETYRGEPQQAMDVYQQILELQADHPVALQSIARLGEKTGDFERAAEALAVLARHEGNPSACVELLHRLGCMQLEKLRDAEAAELTFASAVALVPGHAKTVGRLCEMYGERRDFGKVVKLLLEAEAAVKSAPAKVRLLYEAGRTALESLEDEKKAAQLFERALAIDPDHVDTARPLSEIYWRQRRHAECLPVLELVLRKTDPADVALVQQTMLRLGAVAEALGQPERATRHYQQVLQLDPNLARALKALGRLALAAGRAAEARTYWERLLNLDAELHPKDRVEAHHQLGRCLEQLGERERAIRELQAVLALDPGHAATIQALAGLQVESSNWAAVVELRTAQLAGAPPEQRAALQREIAEIRWRRMGQRQLAEQAYLEALKARPDHRVLHDLIDLYSEMGQWPKTVEMCVRMAELETDPKLRAKYYFTVAVICRDHLDDADRAVQHFEMALDLDPSQLAAFQAIDALCTKRRAWKQLEVSYSRMIKRLPADKETPLKVMLWHNLGEILRSRRRDFERAAAAFEVAARLEPTNAQRQRIVAELYLNLGAPYQQQAVRAHHQLLLGEPRSADLLHTLARLYMQSSQYDRAWCLCGALALLKQADREEQGFYQQYRRQRIPRARAALSDELWRANVHHPDQHTMLGGILALLVPVLMPMTARPAAQFGLDAKDRRSEAHEQLPFVRLLDYAASVLMVVKPELYLQPQRSAALMAAHTQRVPSLVAGAPVLRSQNEKELAFIIGKQLAYLRPEQLLRTALPSRGQLQTALVAAVKLCQPALVIPDERARAVAPIVERIDRQLQPALRAQLAEYVQRFCREGLAATDTKIHRWWNAVDLTSDRVGLILCNDLEVAAGQIGGEPRQADLPPADRMLELLRYATSEPYLALRPKLGLNIDE